MIQNIGLYIKGGQLMKDLFLAKPSKEYEKSFKNYVLSYENEEDEHYFEMYKEGIDNFDQYLKRLENNSKGIDIPEGWVQTSSFWLIHNSEVVGVTRVRHQEVDTAGHIGYDISPCHRQKGYGSEILKLALEEARKIGIQEAIATCNVENIISKKIIEKNNGKLLGTVFDEEENEELYRYSILTNSSM